jgi:hypothetical protein
VANRQGVVVYLDPFNNGDIPSPQVPMPLYFLLIVAVSFGVVLGSLSTWVRQGRFRKAARVSEAKAKDLRAENDLLRGQIAGLKPANSAPVAVLPARDAA